MSGMLGAFKIKEFDLEPVIEAWTNPPIFRGDPSRDMPVDDWLAAIKAGSVERKVPEEYWHKVAQRFMGPSAKARFQEIKNVMAKVNGGKYRWSWKKFSVAMKNMGWDIDPKATETVQLTSKPSGIFWITRKMSGSKEKEAPPVPPKDVKEDKEDKENQPHHEKSSPSSWLATMKGDKRRTPTRSNTDTALITTLTQTSSALKPRPTPSRANSIDPTSTELATVSENSNAVTQVQNAPTWLLNACSALDFLTCEHPRAMSTISAILITAGTLPTIPAIAGGTVLATGVAQAVGAIAVGVGNMLKAQQDGRIEATNGQQQQQQQGQAAQPGH